MDLGPLLAMDAERRKLMVKVETLQAERKRNSQKIGKKEVAGGGLQALIERTKAVGGEIKELDVQLKELALAFEQGMLSLPNLLSDATPFGTKEEDNPMIRSWGAPRAFSFEPKHHADLGESLDILDAPRGVKLAQSRFTLVKGAGAKLERALINFMLDLHTLEHGYQEVQPPLLVNAQTMMGTGQLPKFEADLFKTTEGLYLIPSAEVPVTNIYADEVLPEEKLPVYFTAYTPCFRSEAGSYGKDTKGYIRQHQFNKVELVKFVKPEESDAELEKLVANAEEALKRLELPYRVVQLCSGDLGFSAAKCYDIEVWIPSENRYREISSCSNCTDFQARRAKIRYKPKEGGKPRLLHTLNGSGLAVGRTLVAILENYQQEDGSLLIPQALQPYLKGLTQVRRPKR